MIKIFPRPGYWDATTCHNPHVQKIDNKYYLFYMGNSNGKTDTKRIGLAVSEKPEGPYVKHEKNPILDFSKLGNNRQAEDAYVWFENQKFKMVLRDMGIFCDDVGLYIESEDGIVWGKPKIAWREVKYYLSEPPPSKSLTRYGRFERPQLLLKNCHPVYMFNATQGGKYQTSSGFLFKIEE